MAQDGAFAVCEFTSRGLSGRVRGRAGRKRKVVGRSCCGRWTGCSCLARKCQALSPSCRWSVLREGSDADALWSSAGFFCLRVCCRAGPVVFCTVLVSSARCRFCPFPLVRRALPCALLVRGDAHAYIRARGDASQEGGRLLHSCCFSSGVRLVFPAHGACNTVALLHPKTVIAMLPDLSNHRLPLSCSTTCI